jgi:uncharacterized protein (DUF58 family)
MKLTAILTTVLFLAAAGTVANGWQMFFMAAIVLALPVASLAVGWLALRGLHARRELPSPAWAGDVVPFRLAVLAEGKWPRLFLQADEALPRWLKRADARPVTFDLPASGETRVEYDVELLKRGVYSLSTLSLSSLDPLGLFRFRKSITAPGELVVYPVPEDVAGFDLSGAERFGNRDLPYASARGSGIDLDGVREYTPGDPLRRMHWKTVARTGELHVIEFEEARALSVVIALDTFRGGDAGQAPDSSFEYLVRLAASVAQSSVRSGATVRLVCADSTGLDGIAGRGTEHLLSVYAALARVEPTSEERLSNRLSARLGVLTAGTTLVVLTGDPDARLADAVASYAVAGLRIHVVLADPCSWAGETRARREQREEFLVALNRVGAVVSLMRRHEQQRLVVETIRSLTDVT